MAVLTLEETKQYLRVDSADEDAFISGLIETGKICVQMWHGWNYQNWKRIFLWCGLPSFMPPPICMNTGSRQTTGNWRERCAPFYSAYGKRCSDVFGRMER